MMNSRVAMALGIALLAASICASIGYVALKEPRVWTDSDFLEAIKYGDIKSIQEYLDQGGAPDRTFAAHDRVFSLLQAAILDREEDLALLLFRAGADLAESGATLFTIGGDGLNNLLEAVLEAMPPDEALGTSSGLTAAAFNGYADTVEIYLAHRHGEGWDTELNGAASGAMVVGYDDVTRLLLEAGAPLDGMLHAAARHSSPGMVRSLLSRGLDPNEPVIVTQFDETLSIYPLDLALQRLRRYQAIVSELPAESHLWDFVDNDAAYVIGELLRAGARPIEDAEALAMDGLAAIDALADPAEKLMQAAGLGYLGIIDDLILEHAYDEESLREAVIVALRTDHDDVARYLVSSGAPIDRGPLHYAVAASSPGFVRYLLGLGADPNEIFRQRRPLDFWLEQTVGQDPDLVLHEMIKGGAEVCWLHAVDTELPGNSPHILEYSGPVC